MSSVYGERVDVQARSDGRPTGFVWRSRRYAVRAILEHWVIGREWWRDPEAASETASEAASEAVPGQPELEFWRVEASPAPGMRPGVYELRREIDTGAWALRRDIS
jgi:hypothetical protein